MSESKFSDAKGNCSKEIGDHGDALNHVLVNNQILDLHQSNDQSAGAVNDVEIFQTPVLPRSPHPPNKKLRKRLADMKDCAKYKKEIDDECKRLKNANTSLEDGHVSLKDRCASMKRSLKRQKGSSVYWKGKYDELTDRVTYLSMHILTESNRSENEIQLQERILQLEASNTQLRARNAQLENESYAREVNMENESELGQAKN